MQYPVRGQATSIALEVSQILKSNKKVISELSKLTGQSVSRLEKDLKRDFYLDAAEAVEYGLIDKVLEPMGLGYEGDGIGEVELGGFISGEKYQ